MSERSNLRELARNALVRRGFGISPILGRGIAPGAQLLATKGGQDFHVAVRASRSRRVGITRLRSGGWKTVDDVNLVVAVVPAANDPQAVEVLGFDKSELVAVFDEALKRELGNSPAPALDFPFYLPIDSRRDPSRALGRIAKWTERVTISSIDSLADGPDKYDFENATNRYRQIAAKVLGVQPSNVESISIEPDRVRITITVPVREPNT